MGGKLDANDLIKIRRRWSSYEIFVVHSSGRHGRDEQEAERQTRNSHERRKTGRCCEVA